MAARCTTCAVTFLIASVDAGASCYDTASPSTRYALNWKAEHESFFDEFHFTAGPAATHGAAYFADKSTAFAKGVVKAEHTHAVLGLGDVFNAADGKRRYSAHIATQRRWKYFLATLKFSHVPTGMGTWPAFWMIGDKRWPEGGEMDILEYANHDGTKISVHTGETNKCRLSPTECSKCGAMPDANKMDYDCNTSYPHKLGCAPTAPAGQQTPGWWASHPGVMAVEWTERFVKVFYIPEADMPSDLQADTPRPETWDKWVISYFPFAASNERHPGSCPNPAHILSSQALIFNIELCGDWAGATWDPLASDPLASEYIQKKESGQCQRTAKFGSTDCCSNYITDTRLDQHLKEHAFFNISYLKVFQTVPSPTPTPVPTPAPSPSAGCSLLSNVDCSGHDLLDQAASTAAECCDICASTASCSAFTHNQFDGHGAPHCYLKTGCTSQQSKAGSTSAIMPPCSFLSDMDCSGYDISDSAADTPDECCDLCTRTTGCTAFTHNKLDGHGAPHCYLKSSCTNPVSRSGSNSGTVRRSSPTLV